VHAAAADHQDPATPLARTLRYYAAIPVFGPDYQTFFMTKWKKEFGV